MDCKFMMRIAVLFVLCIASSVIAEVPNAEAENYFKFKEQPLLPAQLQGAVVGFSGENVLSIGGGSISNRFSQLLQFAPGICIR